MSDNELDNLFKEAAEGFKAPQDSSAWQDMASRLDQSVATTTVFWNWKSISVVGLVSVAVVLYLTLNDTDNLQSDQVALKQAVEEKALQKSVERSSPETNSTSSQRENEVSEASGKNESETQTAIAKRNSTPSATKAEVGNLEYSQGGERVVQNSKEYKNPVGVSDYQISSLALENSNSKSQPSATDGGTREVKENSQVVSDSLATQTKEQAEVLRDNAQPTDEKTKPQEKGNKFRPALGLKLTVAPDYTSVKSSTPDRLGFSYGLLLEYRFSNHWSIATGGIWTKKIYTAYDVEYSGYNADWVDGDCRMWDIPVNVYYTFTPGKSFSFYASLGFSSYLMNEENYIFYVETPYGVYDYPQQVKGENNEWFKTLNASIGMQLKLNNKLTLQFEPTLKAPLTGVGEGEVSLVSLGAFFNLRYDLPLNKN